MRFGPPPPRPFTKAEMAAIMNPPTRIQTLRNVVSTAADNLGPIADLGKPYVDGLDNLPRDGRFLLVGNHTQAGVETLLIPYYVRRELGVLVRPLADRGFGQLRGLAGDLLAAAGAVVGHPDSAGELMAHDETVLVFPGGGREIAKFKGEEYRLRWDGRSGFARMAIQFDYPIVPVALVGGDDVYRPLTERDSAWGRLTEAIGRRLGGPPGGMPLVRGVGPTLIPRPERMYLRFCEPIDTTKPARRQASIWEAKIKELTQNSLEGALTDLQQLRSEDPYRGLNPLAWRSAAQPA
ncbi:MAG TPA: lysophospholipid acyltransferase family protein [Mycobacterium sp.]|nr:lysophospholipid acyltransferase family protein [Mycobacterium sp.]